MLKKIISIFLILILSSCSTSKKEVELEYYTIASTSDLNEKFCKSLQQQLYLQGYQIRNLEVVKMDIDKIKENLDLGVIDLAILNEKDEYQEIMFESYHSINGDIHDIDAYRNLVKNDKLIDHFHYYLVTNNDNLISLSNNTFNYINQIKYYRNGYINYKFNDNSIQLSSKEEMYKAFNDHLIDTMVVDDKMLMELDKPYVLQLSEPIYTSRLVVNNVNDASNNKEFIDTLVKVIEGLEKKILINDIHYVGKDNR
ncbi:MAG: hypothetical protein WBO70_02190 [Erysipelotrichaceae bacterium]